MLSPTGFNPVLDAAMISLTQEWQWTADLPERPEHYAELWMEGRAEWRLHPVTAAGRQVGSRSAYRLASPMPSAPVPTTGRRALEGDPVGLY